MTDKPYLVIPQPDDLLIDIEGLSIGFSGANGGAPIVRNFDLTIRRGECVALVGESGSGKSITARSLLNLSGDGAEIDADRFQIKGRNALQFREADWRKLRGTVTGLVMQDALVSLDPLRTIGQEVGEVLSAHRTLRGRQTAARVTDVLRKVGIPDPEHRAAQYAHQLSGGLRQRALIASAIAADPDLIIADEPTTSLDVTVQAQVLAVLAERVREGAGLLLISHDLAVVAGIADRVIVMRDGRIVDSGATADVLRRPRHPYTRQLLAAIPSADSKGHLLASARFDVASVEGNGAVGSVIVREPLPVRKPSDEALVLQVEGISKHYVQRRSAAVGAISPPALDRVTFSVKAGEVVGIVGESGSGKSTCAKIVLGLLAPDEGAVRLLGQRWSGVAEAERRALRARLQYIPQDALSSFDPRYRVADVIAENLTGDARAKRDRIVALLEQVGLNAGHLGRTPRSLSGGQRQRVSIARALAAEPDIIVCDEPVSALDVSIQAQVLDLLSELQARLGTALLFISHDLGVVQHIADRVLVFHRGRIVESGPVDQVFSNPADDYTRALLSSIPAIESAFVRSSANAATAGLSTARSV
jgi:peptide/nickel transport system ATP-binding protein